MTDANYRHTKTVWEDFELKNVGKYYDLYIESNTTMYLKIFEICLEIYELDPALFLIEPGLAFQAALEMIKVNLELLTDIDMLLMVEKGIKCGIFHAIRRHVKTNNKYMNDYNKKKGSPYLKYCDVSNVYG